MSDTKKNQPEKPDQEKGDEVLRRLLETPPKPHKEEPSKRKREDGALGKRKANQSKERR